MNKLPKYTEFECKYRVEKSIFPLFNRIVSEISPYPRYLHVSGPDTFYVKDEGSFGRYRKSDTQFDDKGNNFAQWTVKEKRKGAKNSINRFESNWAITGTPEAEVHAGAEKMGYRKVGKIQKDCLIYTFPDATLVFYTVKEFESDKESSFIEIEVCEATIDQLTEDDAWQVIEKYEYILRNIGICSDKRLDDSLFDLYRRDTK